ncbi:dihydropteroate synthase [Fusarium beomiforme]|uniref:Dihydropteroate synthase n=1 Tax=Fusarium beomiforme TaxID=44412 RepID=A0A9P5AVI1_9HYPO|nr:dihydropteroate synthase [Fusarium beomiforme]
MTDGTGKRKQGPGGNGPATKKSKGGSGGKWQTPHQKARKTEQVELGRTLEVNDAGIWVTYARGMKGKAITEFKNLCNEYGESLFGVKPPNEDGDSDEDDEDSGDIEASIKKELASMAQPKPKTRQTFTPIGTGLDCVFFMKTIKPIEPMKLVTKVCQDAKDCPDPMQRKTKYINRLTPVFDTDKATDKGIERVARSVMESHFELKPESGDDASAESAPSKQEGEGSEACTYAIRYNIRNHTAFKSSEVIKKIADLVSPKHKVNLASPDKVVLVEIFQLTSVETFCGVSVVDGKESEELKRYNLNELYKVALEDKKQKGKPAREGVAGSA